MILNLTLSHFLSYFWRGLCLLPVFLAMGFTGPGLAHADEHVTAVQLSSFTIAGVRANGTRQMMSITLFLELEDGAETFTVCRAAPHIRDTTLITLNKAQPKISRGKLVLDGMDQKLRTTINKVFSDAPVRRVHIYQGQTNIGTGAGRQLGDILGCARASGFDPDS